MHLLQVRLCLCQARDKLKWFSTEFLNVFRNASLLLLVLQKVNPKFPEYALVLEWCFFSSEDGARREAIIKGRSIVTWFKSDILLQNILVWLHCRKCSLKASNLWWQTFYLPVHVVFVGDKMMTNDPNWNHIICRPSIMVNLTCIICCATNISSLKILILMFQSVENGSSWVGLRKSLASIQSGKKVMMMF